MRDHDETIHPEVPASESLNGAPESAAARILGRHYRALRHAAAQSRPQQAQDLPTRGPHEGSVAAAFLLRVLTERSVSARGADAPLDQELRRVRRALRQLSAEAPRLAEVLTLHEIAGLSCDEVAATLGAASADVERDLQEARARISSKLSA